MTDPYYYDDHIVSDPSASSTNLRGTVCVCVGGGVGIVARFSRAIHTSAHFYYRGISQILRLYITSHDETRASSDFDAPFPALGTHILQLIAVTRTCPEYFVTSTCLHIQCATIPTCAYPSRRLRRRPIKIRSFVGNPPRRPGPIINLAT
jgi:hypothetical protein